MKKCEEQRKKPSLYWAVIREFRREWGINGIFLVISVSPSSILLHWNTCSVLVSTFMTITDILNSFMTLENS